MKHYRQKYIERDRESEREVTQLIGTQLNKYHQDFNAPNRHNQNKKARTVPPPAPPEQHTKTTISSSLFHSWSVQLPEKQKLLRWRSQSARTRTLNHARAPAHCAKLCEAPTTCQWVLPGAPCCTSHSKTGALSWGWLSIQKRQMCANMHLLRWF